MKFFSKIIRRTQIFVLGTIVLVLSGCMTVGYSMAKNPNQVQKWNVTVISIEPQNIYNALGVSLVGPFASVDGHGWKIQFIADGEKKPATIVQPTTDRYTLSVGQRAVFIVDRGQAWVQPVDYPLPPEFTKSVVLKNQESNNNNNSNSLALPPVASSHSDSTSTVHTANQDAITRLEELKKMKDAGLISKQDYDKKKQEILKSM